MLERKVYVIQEIPGSQAGTPKINIMGAASYATSNKFNFLFSFNIKNWNKVNSTTYQNLSKKLLHFKEYFINKHQQSM